MTTINKLNREQESSINQLRFKSSTKDEKTRNDVMTLSSKLKDQHITWQKRLNDLDCSSKNLVSKERVRRRNTVQQQLDKTAAVESQLLEIIKGLELMNYELVDKVKSAKRTEQAAIKLYDKSKEIASRRLDKLVLEKEEKNQLKDELTRVLKVQDAQQKSLQEYKAMVEELRSTKQNLKCEFKIGQRGGLRWPLWVTEVCCELLVNGSPPSAIPSSIGCLFAALYGEEPKKIPLLNYVRQCES